MVYITKELQSAPDGLVYNACRWSSGQVGLVGSFAGRVMAAWQTQLYPIAFLPDNESLISYCKGDLQNVWAGQNEFDPELIKLESVRHLSLLDHSTRYVSISRTALDHSGVCSIIWKNLGTPMFSVYAPNVCELARAVHVLREVQGCDVSFLFGQSSE